MGGGLPKGGAQGGGQRGLKNGLLPQLVPYMAFAAAVLVLFHTVIFGDRILLDPSPFRYDPWRCYGGTQDLESEMHQGDNLRSYLPRQFDLWRSVRAGRLPLWNPYAFGGTPFLADPQTRVAYPVSLLLTMFGPTKAMGYDIALHVFLAMAGMYLFIRILKGTVTGGMVGALAYGISSFIYTRFGHPTFVASAAWIPLFFYAFERAQTRERMGTCLLAVFLSLGFLAGFPQVFLLGVGSLTIYVIYMTVHRAACRRWADAGKNLRILAISGVVALLLVSVTLVPFVELLRNSTGLGIEFEEMKRLYQTPPVLLFKSIFPDLFGNAVDRTDWRIVFGETQTIQVSLFQVYCGVGGLLAAILALVFVRRSRYVGAFLILLALSVAVAVSPRVLHVAYRFAFATYSKIDRAAVVSCFAMAAMAGMGFSLISGEEGARRRKWVILVLLVSAAAVVAVSAYFWIAGPSMLDKAAHVFTSLPDGIKLHPWNQMRSARIFDWSRDPAGAWFAFEKAQIVKGLAFTLIGVILLSLYVSLPAGALRLRRVTGAAFLAVLFIDLSLIAGAYFVSQPEYSFFETDGIRRLADVQGENGRWRIQCINSVETSSYPYETAVLPPNLNQIFGMGSLQGTYTMVPMGQSDFRRLRKDLLPRARKGRERSDAFPPGNIPLASLMGVRHLIDCAAAPARSISPVLEAAAQPGKRGAGLQLLSLGDDTRLALVGKMGTLASVDFKMPDASRLDLWLGFTVPGASARHGAGSSDSLDVWVACEGSKGRVERRCGYDVYEDCLAWHKIALDLSPVGSGACKLTMAAQARQAALSADVTVGWSGFDLVGGDYKFTESAGGYRVDMGADTSSPCALSLSVTSPCREVRLALEWPDGHSALRWVGFPERMSLRQVTVESDGAAGNWLVVRSDSAFSLVDAKRVYAVSKHVDFDLIYDADMKIYENFAATEKGICLDKAAVPCDQARTGPVLKFAAVPDLAGARCGSAEILTYQPERVVIKAVSDRPSYLLLQDTYYPGWKASVDGVEAEILKTDLGARAVELPAGSHQVVFRFDPTSVKLGLAGTSLGAILLVLYAVLGSRLRRTRHA